MCPSLLSPRWAVVTNIWPLIKTRNTNIDHLIQLPLFGEGKTEPQKKKGACPRFHKRILVGYSPRGHKESDMTKHLGCLVRSQRCGRSWSWKPGLFLPRHRALVHSLPTSSQHTRSVWGGHMLGPPPSPYPPPHSRWEFRSRGGTFMDESLLEEEKK